MDIWLANPPFILHVHMVYGCPLYYFRNNKPVVYCPDGIFNRKGFNWTALEISSLMLPTTKFLFHEHIICKIPIKLDSTKFRLILIFYGVSIFPQIYYFVSAPNSITLLYMWTVLYHRCKKWGYGIVSNRLLLWITYLYSC